MQYIFSNLADENSQYLFAFTWEQQYSWTIIFIPRVSQSPSYFSQTLKADSDDRKFLEGSTWLKYVDDLLLYPPFSNFFTGDSIHLLKFVALKGYKNLQS